MRKDRTFQTLVPGTVLLDVYEATGRSGLGGAEFNFAYHLQQLLGGVDLIARLGRDQAGRRIRAELRRRGFPTRWVQTDARHPSKLVTVKLNEAQVPCFLIPDDTAAEYLAPPPFSARRLAGYDLVYFGTTLQAGERSRATVRALLAACRGLKFCDLNLRPPKYTPETVEYSLRTCQLLKLSQEEFETLSELFYLNGGNEARLRKISEVFAIPTVCLTLGETGSCLLREGRFFEHRAARVPVVDTVGAGDGFSACLAAGALLGWGPERTLAFASDFAGAICGIPGAVPDGLEFYRPFLARLRAEAG